MRVFDASSAIYAWDNYPLRQFPGLWSWIADELSSRCMVIPETVLEEVRLKTPECAQWMSDIGIHVIPVDSRILRVALQIKSVLGIVGDQYHPKGVDENDLLVISTAKVLGYCVVSDEAKQHWKKEDRLPMRAKFKIPAVCSLPEFNVACVSFVELIKNSGVVFG
jgi:hypothetical protein